MTVIQKEEFRALARERKRKSHEREKKKKELRKSLLYSGTHFLNFRQNQEQNIQKFKLF